MVGARVVVGFSIRRGFLEHLFERHIGIGGTEVQPPFRFGLPLTALLELRKYQFQEPDRFVDALDGDIGVFHPDQHIYLLIKGLEQVVNNMGFLSNQGTMRTTGRASCRWNRADSDHQAAHYGIAAPPTACV